MIALQPRTRKLTSAVNAEIERKLRWKRDALEIAIRMGPDLRHDMTSAEAHQAQADWNAELAELRNEIRALENKREMG